MNRPTASAGSQEKTARWITFSTLTLVLVLMFSLWN